MCCCWLAPSTDFVVFVVVVVDVVVSDSNGVDILFFVFFLGFAYNGEG